MQFKPKKDYYFKISYIILGIIIGFICSFISSNHNPVVGEILLFCNILSIIILYLLTSYKFDKAVSNYLSNLTKDIKQTSGGKMPLRAAPTESKELIELYDTVESLRATLNKNNNTYDTILKIVDTIVSNTELNNLLANLLPEIISGTNSNWGAFYIYNKITEKLELKESLGFSKKIFKEFDINIGEGYAGKAALSGKIEILKDIPDDSVFIAKTVLGNLKPRNLLTLPISSETEFVGLLVVASINEYNKEQIQLIETIRNYLGFAIFKGIEYEDTKRLYKELNFRHKLIEGMNDDLEKKIRERTVFLNNIINSIKDHAISAMDKDGYITMWNEGSEIIRGFSKDEVLNKHITELYPKDETPIVMRRLEIAAKEGKFIDYGWRGKKDGTKYFADVVISATYNEDGAVTGFTNITKDITAMKTLEQSIIYEKALSKKVIDNSTRAITLISLDGVIISSNELSAHVLGVASSLDLIGKHITNFLADVDLFEKSFKELIDFSTRAEWIMELKLKPNVKIKINAAALIDDDIDEISGVLLYFYSELS